MKSKSYFYWPFSCSLFWIFLVSLQFVQQSYAHEQDESLSLPIFEEFDPTFRLESTLGGEIAPQDFKGQVVLITFGYASCPDVCPMILSNLSKALKRAGANAGDAKVLFISIDPERDDIKTLTKYVAYFGPNFIGLSDQQPKIRDVALQYQVMYEKREIDSAIQYVFSHTDYVYMLDKRGQLRTVVKGNSGIDKFVVPIKSLMKESL